MPDAAYAAQVALDLALSGFRRIRCAQSPVLPGAWTVAWDDRPQPTSGVMGLSVR